MAGKDRITVQQSAHGQYQTTVEDFDALLVMYLPASVGQLREKIADKDGRDVDCWADVTTITECLMILAELNGLATN